MFKVIIVKIACQSLYILYNYVVLNLKVPCRGFWTTVPCKELLNNDLLSILTCCFFQYLDTWKLHLMDVSVYNPVDACTLDIGPLLCLLRCWRFRLLLPHLPERGGVVLPPTGLEEPQQPPHPARTAGKGPQETGERTTAKSNITIWRCQTSIEIYTQKHTCTARESFQLMVDGCTVLCLAHHLNVATNSTSDIHKITELHMHCLLQ